MGIPYGYIRKRNIVIPQISKYSDEDKWRIRHMYLGRNTAVHKIMYCAPSDTYPFKQDWMIYENGLDGLFFALNKDVATPEKNKDYDAVLTEDGTGTYDWLTERQGQ